MKRDRLAITVERRVTSSGISLRHPRHPQFHVQSPRGHPGQDGPRRRGFKGSDSQDNQDWICPQVPTNSHFLITPEEPWELITVGGQSINFLLGTRATFSVLTEAPGPLSYQSASIMGLSGQAKIYYFRFFCMLWVTLWSFSHEFLIVPESPSPLLGRDILSKAHASVFMNMEPSLSLPWIEQNVNPQVLAHGKSVGHAQNAIPVVVKLKDPHLVPHKKQYPLKSEVK